MCLDVAVLTESTSLVVNVFGFKPLPETLCCVLGQGT